MQDLFINHLLIHLLLSSHTCYINANQHLRGIFLKDMSFTLRTKNGMKDKSIRYYIIQSTCLMRSIDCTNGLHHLNAWNAFFLEFLFSDMSSDILPHVLTWTCNGYSYWECVPGVSNWLNLHDYICVLSHPRWSFLSSLVLVQICLVVHE